jgi:hypothetical protein
VALSGARDEQHSGTNWLSTILNAAHHMPGTYDVDGCGRVTSNPSILYWLPLRAEFRMGDRGAAYSVEVKSSSEFTSRSPGDESVRRLAR